MSTSQMLLLNIGAVVFLALILTTLMLLPRYLRAHQHPHLERRTERPRRAMGAERRSPRTQRSPAAVG